MLYLWWISKWGQVDPELENTEWVNADMVSAVFFLMFTLKHECQSFQVPMYSLPMLLCSPPPAALYVNPLKLQFDWEEQQHVCWQYGGTLHFS